MNTKNIITLIAAFMLCFQMYAQTPAKEKEQSNAEKFSAKSGTLMQKEFIEIGDVKNCKIKVIHFTDLITGIKQSGLKFGMEVASTYSTDTKSALLDTDEIDGLMKSIKLMQDKVMITVPTNNTEVSFKSRSGFEAGCFTSNGAWSCYLKLEKYDSKSYVWIDSSNLTALYALLVIAKAKM